MNRFIAFLIFFGFTLSYSQSIRWASKVVAVSSEFIYDIHPGQYLGKEALGPPSILPTGQANPCAWSPSSENKETEYIKVSFDDPISVEQIAISESFNPGSITSIWLYDKNDKEYKVYENRSPVIPTEKGRLFRHFIDRTSYKVYSLKLELSTHLVTGYNQIDAIGISDSKKPVEVSINVVSQSHEGHQAENLGPLINSTTDELCPVISPDGQALYFTRYGHPDNQGQTNEQDVWVSHISSEGAFTPAQNLGEPVNNSRNNSLLSITPDGQTALLLNIYLPDGSSKQGVSITRKEGMRWGQPKKLHIKDFYNDNQYGEYFLAADGQALIMTMQRKDSEGSKDLYVSFPEEDGSWTSPRHMGPTINTASSEISPFLAADGVSLYFASSGFPGYGSADVFVSRRLDDTWTNWSEPQNLGPNCNTTGFDAYYSLPASGDYAYFMSYENSIGKGDIFRIKLAEALKPQPVVLIRGYVLNAKTEEPLATDILYESLDRQVKVGQARSNSADGRYTIVLPAGEVYGFLAEAKGFASMSENIDLSELNSYQEINKNLYLTPLEKGQIVPLNNVFFDVDKYSFHSMTYLELDRLVGLLKDNPQLEIEISGHTDDEGTAEYNQTLSTNRAKAVYEYLTEKGIAARRLSYKGYGEKSPITSNDTPEGRQRNRRVEFKVLNK